jgi:hypothetical protein
VLPCIFVGTCCCLGDGGSTSFQLGSKRLGDTPQITVILIVDGSGFWVVRPSSGVIGFRRIEGGYWLASHPGRCTSRENTSVTHAIESCVSSRTALRALEAEKNLLPLPGIDPQFLGRAGTKQINRQIEDTEKLH